MIVSGQNILEYHIVWLRKYLPLISFQLSKSMQLNNFNNGDHLDLIES